jgi:hypothetical protein
LKPGDVVVGVLAGALETKVRPAVVIQSSAYLLVIRQPGRSAHWRPPVHLEALQASCLRFCV